MIYKLTEADLKLITHALLKLKLTECEDITVNSPEVEILMKKLYSTAFKIIK